LAEGRAVVDVYPEEGSWGGRNHDP
jgi:hypothetical protein